VEDRNYRILRHHCPGKYTFIMPATRQVPKIIQSKTHTVGVRIPSSPVCLALIAELGHPIISTTVSRKIDGDDHYFNDADEMADAFGRSVELLLDVGPLYEGPSSVIDLTTEEPTIVRRGSGDLAWLGG
jgi:tRNA threonylcarbamoyl adenosine modification protein (Sua5/YciO/YrdC/YwlC family)